MHSRIRRFRASELFEQRARFSIATNRKMNANRFKRELRRHAAASEFFRKKPRSFVSALSKQQHARQFNTRARKRWTFSNRSTEAVLGALEISAREQTTRDFEMRCRRPFNRMEREVIRGLRFVVAACKRVRTNEHRHCGLTLRIDFERRLECNRGLIVPP